MVGAPATTTNLHLLWKVFAVFVLIRTEFQCKKKTYRFRFEHVGGSPQKSNLSQCNHSILSCNQFVVMVELTAHFIQFRIGYAFWLKICPWIWDGLQLRWRLQGCDHLEKKPSRVQLQYTCYKNPSCTWIRSRNRVHKWKLVSTGPITSFTLK